jgi:hypothetical protein
LIQDDKDWRSELIEGDVYPRVSVRMNYPGIGAGHLAGAFEEIKGVLSLYFDDLDNMTICMR